MTAPLTPPECDLRGYEFMPLYGHHLFGSDFNARVSDTGWRAAVTLWWAAWNQVPAASLPNDDRALARLADLGRDVKSWLKIKAEALHGFILCDDGRLYHSALAKWALEAWNKRVKDRERKAKLRAAIQRKSEDVPRTGRGQDADTARKKHGQDAETGWDGTAEREVRGSERTSRTSKPELPELPRARDGQPVDNSHEATAQPPPPPTSDRKIQKINGKHPRDPQAWMKNDVEAAKAGAKFSVYRRKQEPLDQFVDRIVSAMKALKNQPAKSSH